MFYYKKRFGQNFLVDQSIIQSIVNHINPNKDQTLIEIGPGLGAITAPLLLGCTKLIAIEIDRDMISKLTNNFNKELQNNKLILINQDVLKTDFAELLTNNSATIKTKIIGNLPYNISTPLLFKLFNLTPNSNLESMHFLLQKEIAERLVAIPGNRQYGRLSVMAQYHTKINIVLYVGSNAFKPAPKVESALVQFTPHAILPAIANDYQHFSQIVTAAFSQRRKILANSLKNYCNQSAWEALNLDPSVRAEQVSVADFVKISNFLLSL
jgi:16S rRNA (adenine1518-N6/adenine1519-N6)-dimethyltransferase